MSDVRSVFLPYCLKKQADGRYVVLNRDYKPLGFVTRNEVEYAKYPILAKLRIRPATAAKLSFKGDPNVNAIFLYSDGSVPTQSAAHMRAYLERLALLAKLRIVRERR